MQQVSVMYFHSGNRYGGVEKLLLDLWIYRHYSSDIIPIFVLQHRGQLGEELEKAGAEVAYVTVGSTPYLWTKWSLWYQLWKIIHKYNIRILVSHEIDNHILVWPVVRHMKIKTVIWIHSSGFRLRSPIYQKLTNSLPDMAICTSQHVEREVQTLWPSLKTNFIYHPYAQPSIGELKAQNAKPVILYLGRLVEYKGLGIAIEALGRISHLDFECIIIGTSQTSAEAVFLEKNRRRVLDLKLEDKVKFIGYQESIHDYFLMADVFLHPNLEPEPLGLVFVEALFYQTPIVATHIGGAKEILDHQPLKMGDLVAPNDVDALAIVLKKHIESPPYGQELKANIRSGFSNICDPEESMRKLGTIYKTL